MTTLIRIEFEYEVGHLFHYGHFMVDGVLPLVMFLQTQSPSPTEVLLRGEDTQQQMGPFFSFLGQLFPDISWKYIPRSEFSRSSVPLFCIKGYKFGPYPAKALESLFAYGERFLTHHGGLLVNNRTIILIERGHQRLHVLGKTFTDTGTQRRKLLNHAQVRQTIQHFADTHGMTFQNAVLESMSHAEQVNLFRHAHIVVGQHGAGLCNVVFCRPETTHVVEISNWGLPTIRHLCEAHRLHHRQVRSTMTHCHVESLVLCLDDIKRASS